MLIEDRWPCPNCGNRRTVRVTARRYVCFHCKQHWERERTPTPSPAPAPEPVVVANLPLGPFTVAEIERLLVYRAAVQAGFYTDALPQPRPGARGSALWE
jgi:DNA-directed RNA polymerase subunit RPC12/RpoP